MARKTLALVLASSVGLSPAFLDAMEVPRVAPGEVNTSLGPSLSAPGSASTDLQPAAPLGEQPRLLLEALRGLGPDNLQAINDLPLDSLRVMARGINEHLAGMTHLLGQDQRADFPQLLQQGLADAVHDRLRGAQGIAGSRVAVTDDFLAGYALTQAFAHPEVMEAIQRRLRAHAHDENEREIQDADRSLQRWPPLLTPRTRNLLNQVSEAADQVASSGDLAALKRVLEGSKLLASREDPAAAVRTGDQEPEWERRRRSAASNPESVLAEASAQPAAASAADVPSPRPGNRRKGLTETIWAPLIAFTFSVLHLATAKLQGQAPSVPDWSLAGVTNGAVAALAPFAILLAAAGLHAWAKKRPLNLKATVPSLAAASFFIGYWLSRLVLPAGYPSMHETPALLALDFFIFVGPYGAALARFNKSASRTVAMIKASLVAATLFTIGQTLVSIGTPALTVGMIAFGFFGNLVVSFLYSRLRTSIPMLIGYALFFGLALALAKVGLPLFLMPPAFALAALAWLTASLFRPRKPSTP